MTTLDLGFVRRQFPAFDDPALEGWAFFENAGGSYPCRQVLDRLCHFYEHTKVQPHHPFPLAEDAGRAMDAGPQRLAAWLNVPADHVHVGPSTTQNVYVLAQALGATLGPDEAIVVTNQDHEANSGAWRRMAEARGAELREWRVDPQSGRLDLADLDELLDERVALVTFPHVSNVIGEVNDARAVCDLAHRAGAIAVVDGVAAAPHGLPDVPAVGSDVYLFSTYKTYGPHQGVMVIAPDLVDRLPNQGHFFNEAATGKRLVPAGPDHAQVAALAGIADYLEVLDVHHFGEDDAPPPARIERLNSLWHDHEQKLLQPLLDFLASHEAARLLGPTRAEGRTPTVAFATERPALEVARQLAEHQVMAGAGHFYGYRVVEAVGVDPSHGVTRLSFVHNTTAGEIEQAITALDAVL